jgi:hypothetical protein
VSTLPSVSSSCVTWQQCRAQGIFWLYKDHPCVCQCLRFICGSQRSNPLAIRYHNMVHSVWISNCNYSMILYIARFDGRLLETTEEEVWHQNLDVVVCQSCTSDYENKEHICHYYGKSCFCFGLNNWASLNASITNADKKSIFFARILNIVYHCKFCFYCTKFLCVLCLLC